MRVAYPDHAEDRLKEEFVGPSHSGYFVEVGANEPQRGSQTWHFEQARDRLRRCGVLGGKIRQSAWGGYKFALDVDGHTNAWSNFFARLRLGCCVLKIQSARGYRQWYYDRLKPWHHYLPVRADMSDLIEKIDWCRDHEAECATLANARRQFAHAMTVESEIEDAVQRLETAVGRTGPVALRAR